MDTLPFAGEPAIPEATPSKPKSAKSMASSASAPPAGSQNVNPNARGSYRRVAKSAAITHGYCSPEVAERIFRDAMSAWGMSSSDAATRDDLLGGLAEVLWASTSVETDYSVVEFSIGGQYLSLQVLVNQCQTAINHVNPLRVWIRSFRQAVLACRIHDFLDTPENIAQRQDAASSYGASIDNARFCFDMADALLVSGRYFNGSERQLINDLKIFATSRTQSNAQTRGQSQPSQDTSGGVVGGQTASSRQNYPTVQAAPSSVRSGFASVR